jgi:hypothetical protein
MSLFVVASQKADARAYSLDQLLSMLFSVLGIFIFLKHSLQHSHKCQNLFIRWCLFSFVIELADESFLDVFMRTYKTMITTENLLNFFRQKYPLNLIHPKWKIFLVSPLLREPNSYCCKRNLWLHILLRLRESFETPTETSEMTKRRFSLTDIHTHTHTIKKHPHLITIH